MKRYLIGFILVLSWFGSFSTLHAGIFLEAESFQNLGGWVVDPHSMAQMGSSYVMAHGYGVPVEDAETTCTIPEAGTYTVWVRTRDWTAVWKRGTPAGKFQIAIAGKVLPEILGTNGVEWDWQKAGTVELPAEKVTVALRDLTGFNGRCDAIYLTRDAAEVPEKEAAKLAEFRKKGTGVVVKEYPEEFDLVVIGGGMSGICTAISAARAGCNVVLLQDREVVGGCNSSEIRVSLGGRIHMEPYPALGNIVEEIQPMHGSGGTYPAEYYEDARKAILFKRPNSGARLLTREHVFAVETDPQNPKRITAVLSRNTHTGAETRFRAPLFVDATGDAVIARKVGCEVMYGREARSQFNEINAPVEADRQVMGHSVLWYAKRQEEPTPFPDIDWAIPFTEENVYYIRGGDWEQEAGQYRDMADETEYIRDYGLLSIFSNWNFIKNHSRRKAEFANDALDWVSPIGGKRESYRVVGDLILTQNDLEDHVPYPDATATITWDIDLHFPDPHNVETFGEPFRSCAYHRGFGEPYPVPYRCLYARDCQNLFLAGRHISLTHVAFAAARVMRTLGMLGEVVGMAAGICKEENALPRDIYEKHLDKLKAKMEAGVPKTPTYHTGGIGMHESYHFKDLGWSRIYPNPSPMTDDYKERVRKLGMVHRNEHPDLIDRKKSGKKITIESEVTWKKGENQEGEWIFNGGKLTLLEGNRLFYEDVTVQPAGGTICVTAPGETTFYGAFRGEAGTMTKEGTGTMKLYGQDTFQGTWGIAEGTLVLMRERSETISVPMADLVVQSGGTLFCNARNALGVWTPECRTLPGKLLLEGGTLKGAARQHVNVGKITLHNGRITSEAGNGSDILGNFCLAGEVTCRGPNRIDAQRISFRNDFAEVENGSGTFSLPDATDFLEIASTIHGFRRGEPAFTGILTQKGKGCLLLTGKCETPMAVNVEGGTLEWAGEGHFRTVTVAGTLVISCAGQRIAGDLKILPGGKVVVDLAALETMEKAPLLAVSGKIEGLQQVEFQAERFRKTSGTTFRIDTDFLTRPGSILKKTDISRLETLLKTLAPQSFQRKGSCLEGTVGK
ncbi:MAG: FAD-dependent oxidoreductase [Planctomycetia bacterium]|nr:FAD-dependent oxidoreductase [Planctomycetia bacterium]